MMMKDVYEILKEKGITLPQPPLPREECTRRYRSLVTNFFIVQAAVRTWETEIQ